MNKAMILIGLCFVVMIFANCEAETVNAEKAGQKLEVIAPSMPTEFASLDGLGIDQPHVTVRVEGRQFGDVTYRVSYTYLGAGLELGSNERLSLMIELHDRGYGAATKLHELFAFNNGWLNRHGWHVQPQSIQYHLAHYDLSGFSFMSAIYERK